MSQAVHELCFVTVSPSYRWYYDLATATADHFLSLNGVTKSLQQPPGAGVLTVVSFIGVLLRPPDFKVVPCKSRIMAVEQARIEYKVIVEPTVGGGGEGSAIPLDAAQPNTIGESNFICLFLLVR